MNRDALGSESRVYDKRSQALATERCELASLKDIMTDVSDRMRADLAASRAVLTHSVLKGNANEETVREMVRQYFPRSLDVSTGTVIDSTGRQSRQLDVILSDAARTPIFYEAGGARVIPAECVVAVMEVKTDLTVEELKKSYLNMQSVKELEKKGHFKVKGVIVEEHTLYGKGWSYWPTQFFVFAYESATLDTLKEKMDSLQEDDLPECQIDMICSLQRGVIANQLNDGRFSGLPAEGSSTVAIETDHSLLLFYTLASVVLNQAKVPTFNVLPYIEGIAFGNAR